MLMYQIFYHKFTICAIDPLFDHVRSKYHKWKTFLIINNNHIKIQIMQYTLLNQNFYQVQYFKSKFSKMRLLGQILITYNLSNQNSYAVHIILLKIF